jgi:hypothetical protein
LFHAARFDDGVRGAAFCIDKFKMVLGDLAGDGVAFDEINSRAALSGKNG